MTLARKDTLGLRGSETEEHTGVKCTVYSTFPDDCRDDSPSGYNVGRGFIVTDLGTGSTVEFIDAAGATVTLTATAIVGAFIPVGIREFTANTDVAEVAVFF